MRKCNPIYVCGGVCLGVWVCGRSGVCGGLGVCVGVWGVYVGGVFVGGWVCVGVGVGGWGCVCKLKNLLIHHFHQTFYETWNVLQ